MGRYDTYWNIVSSLYRAYGRCNKRCYIFGKEAVSTALTMLGVISLWTGLMKIGEKAGIVSYMCRKITPFLSRLFPSVPKESKAMEYIGINVIANF